MKVKRRDLPCAVHLSPSQCATKGVPSVLELHMMFSRNSFAEHLPTYLPAAQTLAAFPSSIVNAATAPARSGDDPRAVHDVFENEYVAATADVPSERVNDPPATRISPLVCNVVTTPLLRPLPSVLHLLAAGSQLQMPTHPREPAVVKAPATITRSLADELDPEVLR